MEELGGIKINGIDEFLKTMCEQIRWKKSHALVSEEIKNHIIDQKEALMMEGVAEDVALNLAIEEMGDPIGTDLDRRHRPRINLDLFFIFGLMVMAGFLIRGVFALEFGESWDIKLDFMISLIGFVCMVFVYFLDFSFIGKYPLHIFVILTIALTYMIFMNRSIIGVRYFLILYPVIMAGIIYKFRSKSYLGILMSLSLFLIPIMICLRSSNLSILLVISISFFCTMFMAILKGWFKGRKLIGILTLILPTIFLGGIFLYRLLSSNYYRMVLLGMVNAGQVESLTMSLEIRNVLLNSSFIGPNMVLDVSSLEWMNIRFLLTYMISRFGWISIIGLAGLVYIFYTRSLKLYSNQSSVLGKLIASSILITFVVQIGVYFLSNTIWTELSSTFPFISHDETSMIVNMILMGIMFSVFRNGYVVKDRFLELKKGKN